MEDFQQIKSLLCNEFFFAEIFTVTNDGISQIIGYVHIISNFNIVDNAQLREQTDILEGTRHAHLRNLVRFFTAALLTVKIYLAFGRCIYTGNHIEGCCLAGAVRTDKANQLSLVDMHGKIGNGTQAAENHGYIIYLQQFCHCPYLLI